MPTEKVVDRVLLNLVPYEDIVLARAKARAQAETVANARTEAANVVRGCRPDGFSLDSSARPILETLLRQWRDTQQRLATEVAIDTLDEATRKGLIECSQNP